MVLLIIEGILNKSREFSWLLLLTLIYKFSRVVINSRKIIKLDTKKEINTGI